MCANPLDETLELIKQGTQIKTIKETLDVADYIASHHRRGIDITLHWHYRTYTYRLEVDGLSLQRARDQIRSTRAVQSFYYSWRDNCTCYARGSGFIQEWKGVYREGFTCIAQSGGSHRKACRPRPRTLTNRASASSVPSFSGSLHPNNQKLTPTKASPRDIISPGVCAPYKLTRSS